MRLSSLAVALFPVLLGAPASAASIQNIDLRLQFDGNSYFDATVTDMAGQTLFTGDVLTQAEDVYGLPRLFNFGLGQILRFTASLDFEGTGSVLSCNLGGLDCAIGADLDSDRTFPLSIFYGEAGWFYGDLAVNSILRFDFAQFATNIQTASGDLASWNIGRGEFTVLADLPPQPAPIPLPAGMLLLPAGIGALAMLRRRKA